MRTFLTYVLAALAAILGGAMMLNASTALSARGANFDSSSAGELESLFLPKLFALADSVVWYGLIVLVAALFALFVSWLANPRKEGLAEQKTDDLRFYALAALSASIPFVVWKTLQVSVMTDSHSPSANVFAGMVFEASFGALWSVALIFVSFGAIAQIGWLAVRAGFGRGASDLHPVLRGMVTGAGARVAIALCAMAYYASLGYPGSGVEHLAFAPMFGGLEGLFWGTVFWLRAPKPQTAGIAA